MRPGIIIAILLAFLAGCSKKTAEPAVPGLNTNAAMLTSGLRFRSDPLNRQSALEYLNLLVESNYYVAASTILDEQADRYSQDEEFRELYADLIRRAALCLRDRAGSNAYSAHRDPYAGPDTLLQRISRIREIDCRIREEGPAADLYLDRGILYLQLMEYQAAGYDFREAFRLDPCGYLPFYYNLYLDYQQGMYTEALVFLNLHKNTIIYTSDRNQATVHNMESLLKGLSYIDKDTDLDEKTQSLEKAKLLLGVNDIRQALEEVNRAISLDENFGDAYALRALMHHEMNLNEQALTDLEKAERISGKFNTPLAKKIRNN